MSFTYKASATITIDLELDAESYDNAEEIIRENVYGIAFDDRLRVDQIGIDNTHLELLSGEIEIDHIDSDDDPDDDEVMR